MDYSVRRRKSERKKEERDRIINEATGITDRVNPDYAKKPFAAKLEEAVVGMLLRDSDYVSAVVDGKPPSPEDFPTELGRRLFTFIRDAREKGGFEFGQLSESFTPDEVSRAMKLMLAREKLTDNSPDVFAENLRRMRDNGDSNGGEDVDEIARLLLKKRGGTDAT